MISFIRIPNSILGEQYFPSEGVWKWVNDPTGAGEETAGCDQPLTNEELIKITNWRFNSQRKASITAVFGDPDFLPFSFLTKGTVCGAAVCRLVRYYGCVSDLNNAPICDEPNTEQCENLQLLIEVLKKQNQIRETKFTLLNLSEILSIKPEEREAFFQGYEAEPLNALTVEKLRKLMPIPFGTGFLVGKNYLLTNHHVLPTQERAKEFLAQFGYERDIFGRITLPVEYELDANFFVTSSTLDYTLVKVKCKPDLGEAGDNFGYLKMIDDSKLIAPPLTLEEVQTRNIESELSETAQQRLRKPNLKGEIPGLLGDPVTIIQHPKGQPKEIVLFSNRVQEITQDFIRYEADVDFSSSGSPVLNQQWQLVGLHHASLADKDLSILSQEGIRIYRIIQDLKSKREALESIVFKLEKAIEVVRDCTDPDQWAIVVLALHANPDSDISKSPLQTAKDRLPLNNKTIKVILFHRAQQERGDFASIDPELVKKELLTFAAEGINQVVEQLKKMESPFNSLTSVPLSEDLVAWAQDNIRFLGHYAGCIKRYASDLQRFTGDQIDIPATQAAYG